MELSEYSTKELKAELRKRKINTNNDWYYIYEDENETNPEWMADFPSFTILHKRRYHLLHEVQQTRVSGLLNLPKNFTPKDNYRCIYKFKREVDKAQKELQDFGFIKLSNPYLGEKAMLYHKTPLFETKWRTENLVSKLTLENFLLDVSNVDSFESYVKSCKEYAESINHVAFFFTDICPNIRHLRRSSLKLKDAALVPKEIAEKLPQNPFLRNGDEE